jgi:hypothetical protein
VSQYLFLVSAAYLRMLGRLVGSTLLFMIVEKPLSLMPRRKPADVPVTTSGMA